ncbi:MULTISPECIES: DUF2066 domain-containing protein [unclassified Pseudoalteromonas]|uniref:DUF2066 domain-containing protein n=1 Tax=unclassified Pseudoalteromonas TaxID=194690 RepID=UPI0023589E23|nr:MULTISPECIES: DUF2066 domain-containing protein [unclassified Pseudoalteromonas]MDC9565826.1 DUF2066 domain-containing protein [Pseudoalteromonas sp. GAB2316C]MDC9570159.1 DUF2066 domain-containing protein [Pseudoalteromonas sp. GABNB9D]MDC9574349.1 DUF2066 domain-containing protein [Pseudoalteromonas sp. GABNS16A]MDC9578669.1 DUF2066 domain-containing protein [Pseudoalteromonas sp. GABNS16E]MDC9586240.1 DUF2066 domain-containing protein [Pseudoalteromonas sp. GABNS16C]
MYRLLISAISFIFCFSVSAVEVTDLYQDILKVDDKSRDTRLAASRKALLNVLVKVSGDETADQNKLAQQRTKNISDYMLKFEYDEKANGQLNLVVKFEARKINELIKELNLPLWGVQRPLVAIWLGIEDNWRRELVTQESYPQLEQLIYDKAGRRGLPVVVPLLDLQDRRLVGIPEVWGNFSEPVEEASRRYSAERSITARMYQEPDSETWILDWRFTNDDLFDSNRLEGDKQQIVGQMIDSLALGLANEYAIDPNAYYEQAAATLTLKGTQSFVDIELAKRRLQSLSVVTQATIMRKTPEFVEFKLNHTGSVGDLKKGLGLDSAFRDYVDPRAFYHVVDKNSLEYQWVGQ